MFVKSAFVSLCLASLCATPSLAGEKTKPVKHSAHRSLVIAGSKKDAHKAKHVVADQVRHNLRIALWPVYYYGCNGDSGGLDLDCDNY